MVEVLLENGSDVNARDDSNLMSLHMASAKGYLGVVDVLIQRGAEVDVTDKNSNWTPLHFAAWYGHKNVVDSLVKGGCDIKAKDSICLLYTSPSP